MAFIKRLFKNEGEATATDPRIDAQFLNDLQDALVSLESKKTRPLVDSGKQTFATGTLYWYKYDDGELEMYGLFNGYRLDAEGKASIDLPVSFVGAYAPLITPSFHHSRYTTVVSTQQANRIDAYFSLVDGTPRPMKDMDQSFGLLLKGRWK